MEGNQALYHLIPPVVNLNSLVLESTPPNIEGGFGDVYRAQHPEWGVFALKKPRGLGDPDSSGYKHLLHEAAMWKNARHPNVLLFIGVWEANNTIYLVSPWLDGGTVMAYLNTHSDADRTKFILDIAKGLSYLHKKGIVHGDIKGNNILISPTLDALVADFGLAKLVDNSTAKSLKGAGSVRWQGPEILCTNARRDFSSDVYSFGMTIYEILSGRIPFYNLDKFGIIHAVVIDKRRPDPEPKLSETGISYAMQWRAARCSWVEDAKRRPNMPDIVKWLESEGTVRGRIRVVCETNCKYNGYVTEMDGSQKGQVLIKSNAETASIYTSSLRGPFPQEVCKYILGENWSSPVGWAQLWSQAWSMLSRPYQTIRSNARDANIWMTSDGEKLETRFLSATATPERLCPIILPALTHLKLFFCSDSPETREMSIARIGFEQIDSDPLIFPPRPDSTGSVRS